MMIFCLLPLWKSLFFEREEHFLLLIYIFSLYLWRYCVVICCTVVTEFFHKLAKK